MAQRLIGYRFHPSDEEIINFIEKKNMRDGTEFHQIKQVDICNFEPSELPALSPPLNPDDEEWYFFNPISYKYANSTKMDRTAKGGFWKVTGKDREIWNYQINKAIGIKKTLVYYQKTSGSKASKTSWVIHEFHSKRAPPSNQNPFVLCRLRNKSDD